MIYLSSKGGVTLPAKDEKSQSKKINQSVIVKAAFDVLLEEGIKKISIRNIADRLQIKGASIYWHIKNKDELLELLAEEICKEICLPDEGMAIEEQILKISHEFRKVLLKYQDSAYVLVETAPTTPYRLEIIKRSGELLHQLGLRSEDIFSASWMLNNYITSFVLEEYRFNNIPKDNPDTLTIMEKLPFDLSKMQMKNEFQFGLEVLLDGFKSKIK